MANTEMLRCIRKNIGYVCADGFWSSAEILENSLVLAKMQILQNARWVRLRGLCSFPNKAGDDGNSSFSKCIQKRIAKTRRPDDSAFLPPCRIHVDLSNNHA